MIPKRRSWPVRPGHRHPFSCSDPVEGSLTWPLRSLRAAKPAISVRSSISLRVELNRCGCNLAWLSGWVGASAVPHSEDICVSRIWNNPRHATRTHDSHSLTSLTFSPRLVPAACAWCHCIGTDRQIIIDLRRRFTSTWIPHPSFCRVRFHLHSRRCTRSKSIAYLTSTHFCNEKHFPLRQNKKN